MQTETAINTQQYRQIIAEVRGTWCAKNDTHILFPVDGRSHPKNIKPMDKCICCPMIANLHYYKKYLDRIHRKCSL